MDSLTISDAHLLQLLPGVQNNPPFLRRESVIRTTSTHCCIQNKTKKSLKQNITIEAHDIESHEAVSNF
jgi:hypothetical protein